MSASETLLEEAAAELASRLFYLRPSQQRELSRLLESETEFSVLSRAIELALGTITAENVELLERVFLLGLELRQVFDLRAGSKHRLLVHWEDVDQRVRKAFVGGFQRQPLDRVLAELNGPSDGFIADDIDSGEENDETINERFLHH